ncbi:MAG: hypothetical protein M0Z71_00150 [Nitrospiraceae bacterium]|nr:hypothetical protein [Nitrospiraceae bacterium]
MTILNLTRIMLLILALFPTACLADNKMVLERKDIQFFKVEEINRGKSIALKISGLAFHSALAVTSIKKEEQGSSLLILVYLGPAKEGLSGSFSFEVPVPDSVKDVRFGNEKTVIWVRK